MDRLPRGRRIAVVLLLAVTAAACTGTGGRSRPAPAPPERAAISAGILPTTAAAPLLIAIGEKFFQQEGLTVSPVVVTGGGAALPQLNSGMLDIAQTDFVSAMLAHSKGMHFTIAGGLHEAAPGSFALVTAADSPIAFAADLKGEKIAVNNLASMSTLMVADLLKAAGLTTDDVVLAETPFPEMAQRLGKGKADAAWLAVRDRAEVDRVLPTFMRLDRGVAEAAVLGVYTTDVDERGLQRVADYMRLHEYVHDPLDVAKVLAAG